MFHVKHPQLAEPQRMALGTYRTLLERYHRTLDLMSSTAIADWDRHLAGALDVAAGMRDLPPGDLLDLGSGAGLPGVVVAIALPKRRVHLVERRRRRGAFLELVAGSLDAARITVHIADVRDLDRVSLSPAGVVGVAAQAVAPFADVYRLTRHLHAPGVRFASRKGDGWDEEIDLLEACLETTIEAEARPTEPRGTLVAFDVPGGRACPSSE